jgi:hypothetical protein
MSSGCFDNHYHDCLKWVARLAVHCVRPTRRRSARDLLQDLAIGVDLQESFGILGPEAQQLPDFDRRQPRFFSRSMISHPAGRNTEPLRDIGGSEKTVDGRGFRRKPLVTLEFY